MKASEYFVFRNELFLLLPIRVSPNEREGNPVSRLVTPLQALSEAKGFLRSREEWIRSCSVADDVGESGPSKGEGEGSFGDAKDGGKNARRVMKRRGMVSHLKPAGIEHPEEGREVLGTRLDTT